MTLQSAQSSAEAHQDRLLQAHRILADAYVNIVRKQVEHELRAGQLQQLLDGSHHENGELGQVNAALRENIQSLSNTNAALAAALAEANAQLQAIVLSNGWKLLQRYHAVRRLLMPAGSWRHRLARFLLNVCVSLVSRHRAAEAKRIIAAACQRGGQNELQTGILPPAVSTAPCLPPLPSALETAEVHGPPPANAKLRTMGSYRVFRVLFVDGWPRSDSSRFRVINVTQALALAGVESLILPVTEVPGNLDFVAAYDLVVFFRIGYSVNVRRVAETAKQHSIPLVFDVDDYNFEPAIVPCIDGIRMSKLVSPLAYSEATMLARTTWQDCDANTAPTTTLIENLIENGKPGYIIKNALSAEWLALADRARRERAERRSDGALRIGYFPGSLTHQKDFERTYRALVRILKEHPNVKFAVSEKLEQREFPLLADFGERIEKIPYTDWKGVPAMIAQVDINLAPLEVGNPFCEAKSELKYFDAAAVKVPTVASPTRPFVDAITHGENGFLADSEDEWYESIRRLVTDPGLRLAMAEAAYRHVMASYSPAQTSAEAVEVYRRIIKAYRRGKGIGENALVIVFVISEPTVGNAGHGAIFSLANRLVRLGHQVTVLSSDGDCFLSADALHRYIEAHFVAPDFICSVETTPPCCDALIATDWRSAERVQKHRGRAHVALNFIQDYEFCPKSTAQPVVNVHLDKDDCLTIARNEFVTRCPDLDDMAKAFEEIVCKEVERQDGITFAHPSPHSEGRNPSRLAG